MRVRKTIKQNGLTIFAITVIILLIAVSFFQYFHDYYSYAPYYDKIKQECKETKDEYTCKILKNTEDPKEKFKKLDAITLSCEIVENNVFSYIQILGPLLIIIIVINKTHKEISSGMFKNYLLRMKYKDYIKKISLESLKAAVIFPISLLTIFVISCIITGFNFEVDKSVKAIAVYEEWKYNNFILYGLIICVVQFFMSIFYGNIGLICCKKNKSKSITILSGYLVFFIIDIIVYVVVFAFIINNILGFHNLMRYFNLLDFWSFQANTNFIALIFIALSLALISYITMILYYKNKERMIIANEKENS